MNDMEIKKAVETLLFITDSPIGVAKICQAVGSKDKEKVAGVVSEIQSDYEERGGLQMVQVASEQSSHTPAVRPTLALAVARRPIEAFYWFSWLGAILRLGRSFSRATRRCGQGELGEACWRNGSGENTAI